MSNKKIYVGNLDYGVDDNELAGVFASFGEVVSAKVITDRDTGQSKGFGFVEMDTPEAAAAAISGLNGQEHNGRPLKISEAREQNRSGGGNRGGGGGRGGNFRGGGGRDRW